MESNLPPWTNLTVQRAPKTLTVESIASMPDKDVEEYIANRMWDAWSSYNYNADIFVKTLPAGAQAFFITWLIEGEVENGGFHQLYWNGYASLTKLAPLAFEYFGASEHAAVVRGAIAERAKEFFLMSILRAIGNYSWSVRLSRLSPYDERYYNLPKSLSSSRIAKIRAFPNSFLLSKYESV